MRCPGMPQAAQGFIPDLPPPFFASIFEGIPAGHEGKSGELCTGTMHSSRTRRPWGERTPDPWTAFYPSSSPTIVLIRSPPTTVMSTVLPRTFAPMTICWLKALVSTRALALACAEPVT